MPNYSRMVGQPEVIRFIRHAARWRRFFWLFPRRRFQLSIPLGLHLLLMPGEQVLLRDVADGASLGEPKMSWFSQKWRGGVFR
jgi:hypothetical protein